MNRHVVNPSLRICTSEEMRGLDQIAEKELGIGPAILMENAGRAATESILREYPDAGLDGEIVVFAGKGNNAGDAFVVARHLMGLHRKVRIFHLLKREEYKGATATNFEILAKMKARLFYVESAQDVESFFDSSPGPFLAIDGILGTGLKGNLEGLYYDLVTLINDRVDTVVSLDIPTGVAGESGVVLGNAIHANLTISFGFPRLGHFLPPGAVVRGKLVNVDISLPAQFKTEGDKFLLRPSFVFSKLSKRDRYGHKNTFGHVLLIGGSFGRTGAISMATSASLRTGSGLATAGTWTDSISQLLFQLPQEAMSVVVPKEEERYEAYRELLKEYSSLVIGPGIGVRPEAKRLIETLLQEFRGPLVLDADALNIIAEGQLHGLLVHRKTPAILTPHPGEMARLIRWNKEDVVRDPLGAIKKCVELTHSVVILKGAATLVSAPSGVLYLNHFPNSGMATAGSGDVLAGMLGGLLGQGIEPFDAAILGVYLHSLAGDLAVRGGKTRGMTAGDIIEQIPFTFQELEKLAKQPEEPRMARLL